MVGGLPRTGKTILRNTLGSHGQIAFTPTAFNFFYWFSKESYANRGGFQENLDYFLKNNWISEKWGIKNEKINIIGKSRKDLLKPWERLCNKYIKFINDDTLKHLCNYKIVVSYREIWY